MQKFKWTENGMVPSPDGDFVTEHAATENMIGLMNTTESLFNIVDAQLKSTLRGFPKDEPAALLAQELLVSVDSHIKAVKESL